MDAVGFTASARAKRFSRKAEKAATPGTPWLSITLEGIFTHCLAAYVDTEWIYAIDISFVEVDRARRLNEVRDGLARGESSVASNSL